MTWLPMLAESWIRCHQFKVPFLSPAGTADTQATAIRDFRVCTGNTSPPQPMALRAHSAGGFTWYKWTCVSKLYITERKRGGTMQWQHYQLMHESAVEQLLWNLEWGLLALETEKSLICISPEGLLAGCMWVGEALTPVLWFPLLMQPARQGLKYVIPSDPQTGSYSWILHPQLTLQLPVRFLWAMARVGLKKRKRTY